MLKITIHDSPEALTFQVEGKLMGGWAKELEQSWKTPASIRDRKALIVGLTETLYIDDEGKRVLKKLFREGAFFRTAGPMTNSVVDEITGKSTTPWRGIVTQSIVLLVVSVLPVVQGAADPLASLPALKLVQAVPSFQFSLAILKPGSIGKHLKESAGIRSEGQTVREDTVKSLPCSNLRPLKRDRLVGSEGNWRHYPLF